MSLPLALRTPDGAILPDPAFHRPFNKLHSRCVEYPFALDGVARFLGGRPRGARVLDLGAARAAPRWLAALGALAAQTGARITLFDVDAPPTPPTFTAARGDARRLPFADGTFDVVVAVSVLEHIGLLQAQADTAAAYSADGDLEAVADIGRVLKDGGLFLFTVPFGARHGYTPDASARAYTAADLDAFAANFSLARAPRQEYYEYIDQSPASWQRLPLHEARAKNWHNQDGVACAAWEKGS